MGVEAFLGFFCLFVWIIAVRVMHESGLDSDGCCCEVILNS